MHLARALSDARIIPQTAIRLKLFSVYIDSAKKKLDPDKHWESGLNPSKTSA